MARPPKVGVDYWNKDVSFYSDKKIRLLRSEFGAAGMYALDYILCEIYRNDGYYALFDKDWCDIVSDGAVCGGSSNFIEELVKGCVRRSFFDKRVFDMFGVITSKGIQKRYIRMASKRSEICMKKEYFLLDWDDPNEVPEEIRRKILLKSLSGDENRVSDVRNSVNDVRNTQSKVKQSKVKQSKAKQSKGAVGAAAADNGRIDKAFFDATGKHLSSADHRAIRELTESGVSESLMEDVIQDVGRRGGRIHSFAYFIPAIRDAAQKNEHAGLYPSTAPSEYIETVLDEEFLAKLDAISDDEYIYDD